MRFFCCMDCQTCWQLGGDLKEIQHLLNMLDFEKGQYPCIKPHCNGRLMSVFGVPHGFEVKEIPIRAFYRAVHGFGSGEGKEASVEKFTELLRTKKIVEVQAIPVGQPERVILRQIVLEDGTRLHFDSSSRGACCYYIEEHSPSCVEVVENELSSTTAEVSKPDREETGRASQADGESGASSGRHAHDAPTTSEQPSAGGVSSVSEASDVPPDNTRDGGPGGSPGTGPSMRL